MPYSNDKNFGPEDTLAARPSGASPLKVSASQPGAQAARRPRIGLDLHCFDGPHQGIRSHVLGLFPEVILSCPDVDFVAFAEDLEGLAACDPAWSLPNVELVPMNAGFSAKRLLHSLPALARRCALDLLHVQYVAPPRSPVPYVVTLHDVLFESHPHLFPLAFRLRSKILMRRTARSARCVVTVSSYSRDEILSRYQLDPDRVTVVPNAVDTTRFQPGSEGQAMVQARGLVSHGYVLSVGRLERRKNLDVLVRAHAALGPSAPPLVLVGNLGLGGARVLRKLEPWTRTGRVQVFQDVRDRELPSLYRHALVFCYPSEAEGFGMPPLEAMASGTPVITSSSTALPEVVGSAGIQVAPRDEAALSHALRRLVFQPHERAQLAANGLSRARSYRWSNGAKILSAVYRANLLLSPDSRAACGLGTKTPLPSRDEGDVEEPQPALPAKPRGDRAEDLARRRRR